MNICDLWWAHCLEKQFGCREAQPTININNNNSGVHKKTRMGLTLGFEHALVTSLQLVYLGERPRHWICRSSAFGFISCAVLGERYQMSAAFESRSPSVWRCVLWAKLGNRVLLWVNFRFTVAPKWTRDLLFSFKILNCTCIILCILLSYHQNQKKF